MSSGASLYPRGWTHADGQPADDLDLVVLLINSHDNLVDPPDRLATIDWYAAVLTATGHDAHAADLKVGDAPALRRLRHGLRSAFAAPTAESAAQALNPLLLQAAAVPLLVPLADGGISLAVAPGRTGLPALAARLPAALAAYIAQHGVERLGLCAARPCACAYIDRSRAGNRRYCCDPCNDRAAAAAYRRRSPSRELRRRQKRAN